MAAIEAPVGGPLLSGLPQIVALAHSEHSTRGLFSGLAALDKNLEVTLRSSPFCRKLFNLKRNHLVYLRILDWAMGVLDEIPVTILQLPNSASPGTPNVFSQKQARATMRARAQDCFRVDRQDLMERLDGLVGEFMYWFEDRVIELHEENYGNFFGAGFGVEVAGKVLGKVDVLLRPHGGMLDGEAA
eukprot:contig_3904_g859